MTPADIQVINNKTKHRFEATVDGKTAVMEYQRVGEKIIFTHTETPSELEGQGIASKMAKVALEFAREHQLRVLPLCPFVKAYIQRHPEYRDLVG